MATATRTKRTIRGKDAMSKWGRGQSSDRGIASRARSVLTEISPDAAREKVLRAASSKVVKVVDGLDELDQRAVLLSAGSDFTLDSLLERSRATATYGPRLGARDEQRIAMIRKERGDAAADSFAETLLWSKVATRGANGSA